MQALAATNLGLDKIKKQSMKKRVKENMKMKKHRKMTKR